MACPVVRNGNSTFTGLPGKTSSKSTWVTRSVTGWNWMSWMMQSTFLPFKSNSSLKTSGLKTTLLSSTSDRLK